MGGFIQKYIKKVRNLFHIPGEDVILIGLDDRNRSIRIYDLFIKTGPKFESKMESKVVEGNVAQVFMWFNRLKLKYDFFGTYDKNNPNILHVQFDIDKTQGCIFKTEDKPEGIAYLVDMQTGQGAQLLRKTVATPTTEQAVSDSLFEGEGPVIIPKQVVMHRDQVIDLLVSINPYFWGSTIDSFIATELLRGKVEIWKMALVGALMLIFGLVIGMGMK